jgi:hypothetical protein
MVVEIIRKEDLADFQIQLLNDIRDITRQEKMMAQTTASKKWI